MSDNEDLSRVWFGMGFPIPLLKSPCPRPLLPGYASLIDSQK